MKKKSSGASWRWRRHVRRDLSISTPPAPPLISTYRRTNTWEMDKVTTSCSFLLDAACVGGGSVSWETAPTLPPGQGRYHPVPPSIYIKFCIRKWTCGSSAVAVSAHPGSDLMTWTQPFSFHEATLILKLYVIFRKTDWSGCITSIFGFNQTISIPLINLLNLAFFLERVWRGQATCRWRASLLNSLQVSIPAGWEEL